jgi:hypothetical protein
LPKYGPVTPKIPNFRLSGLFLAKLLGLRRRNSHIWSAGTRKRQPVATWMAVFFVTPPARLPPYNRVQYSWIACSHVCASWRQIALDTPLLWGHVVFESRAWVSTCLERSKSSLLIVTADTRLAVVETLVCDVLKMTERIARIHLRFSVLSQLILDLLPGPFPRLTDLSVENYT